MTDDVQTQAHTEEAPQTQVPADVQVAPAEPAQVAPADPVPPTLEEVQAKRNAENLERAKANGYVEADQPSISERVIALVDGVARAIEHNAPISREHFEEMKALLGYREGEQIDPPAGV